MCLFCYIVKYVLTQFGVITGLNWFWLIRLHITMHFLRFHQYSWMFVQDMSLWGLFQCFHYKALSVAMTTVLLLWYTGRYICLNSSELSTRGMLLMYLLYSCRYWGITLLIWYFLQFLITCQKKLHFLECTCYVYHHGNGWWWWPAQYAYHISNGKHLCFNLMYWNGYILQSYFVLT